MGACEREEDRRTRLIALQPFGSVEDRGPLNISFHAGHGEKCHGAARCGRTFREDEV